MPALTEWWPSSGRTAMRLIECHAFFCAKRRVAQAAALIMSQAFQVAYQAGQGSRQAAAASQDADSQPDNQVEANGNKEVE
ncbi:hypothetical protein MRX96_003149 [Rhipicephalus microplus]